jgi:hypothetical protein
MEIFVYYVLPNVLLFGSIYLFARAAESAVWYGIENYHRLKK